MILFILQRLLQTHASRAFNPSLCFSLHYKIKKDIPGNASKKTQWKQMLEAIMIEIKACFQHSYQKKKKLYVTISCLYNIKGKN